MREGEGEASRPIFLCLRPRLAVVASLRWRPLLVWAYTQKRVGMQLLRVKLALNAPS